MNNQFIDLYAILELTRYATQEEIKKAHRDLARKYHPDVNTSKIEAGIYTKEELEEKFKKVQEAYDILKNEKTKKEYDMEYDEVQRQREERRRQKQSTEREYSRENPKYKSTRKSRTGFAYDIRNAYEEVISEEIANKNKTLRQRHNKISNNLNRKFAHDYKTDTATFKKYYHEDLPKSEWIKIDLEKGIIHVTGELAFWLRNLSTVSKDTVTKWTIRNRRIAYALALAAIINVGIGMITPDVNIDTSTLADETISTQVEEETNTAVEYDSEYVKLYRYHALSFTDTISQLASDAGCYTSDITHQDGSRISNPSQVQQGWVVRIPYTIDKDDLKYYEYSVQFDHATSLEEFAEKYGTDAQSIYNLNREAIEYENGTYTVLSDTLNVPNFISLSDLKEKQSQKSYN